MGGGGLGLFSKPKVTSSTLKKIPLVVSNEPNMIYKIYKEI